MQINVRRVAELCGVSVASVSRAFSGKRGVSDETRQRILRVAQEMGYRPFANSVLSRRPAPFVALILPENLHTVSQNPFHSMALQGAIDTMEERHGTFVVPSTGALRELCEMPLHLSALRGAEGALVLYRRLGAEEYLGLRKAGIPCIVVGYKPEVSEFGYVRLDIKAGMELAVRHLAELGHKRIGYWGWDRPDSLAGFRKGLTSCGLPVRKDWIVVHSPKALPAASWDERYPWHLLRSADRPTGFVCHGDTWALEMIRRMRDMGYEAPRDFSIVGFDDLPLASVSDPPLTTIRQPVYEMARKASRHLLAMIGGERASLKETVAPILIVRRSTGPPPRVVPVR